MIRHARARPRRTTQLMALAILAALGGGGVGGCDSGDPSGVCFCTEQFVFFTVRVVDAAGAPVTGLTVTMTRVRDGRTFDVGGGDPLGTPGVYLVMDDRFKQVIGTRGDLIRFEARKAGRLVSADFVFRVDPCRCHVEKVSGPAQIVF